MRDGPHTEYDWCITFWYDGPHRAWAVVPSEDAQSRQDIAELRTDLLWKDDNGDSHIRLSREELQHAIDMLDGKAVYDEQENVTRVFGGMAPRWPNS